MTDDVEKTFVRSFVGFLKSKIDSQTLAPDAQESIEVAMQCLQAAFDCEDAGGDTPADAANNGSVLKDVDLFEMFQSTMIERNPDTVQLAERIKNTGNQLMKDGKYNEALLQYNRAIAFDPKNPIFYCNRAAAFIRLGDNERAITDCKSALVYNQNYGKAYGRLGIAFSNLGRYQEAQQAYAKAIELEPDNQDYRTNLEVARNATTQQIPQLSEGLNLLLNIPSINNLMSSAGLDMGQLHSMSQNPMVMNAVGQMLTALQSGGLPGQGSGGGIGSVGGGNAGGGGGNVGGGQLPAELMQFMQTMSEQLASRIQGGTGGNNQPGNPPQPPPST